MTSVQDAKPIHERALIIDDQPLFRAGLRQLLRDELAVSVIEAPNATAALGVADTERVDIVIMELSLGREQGLSLIAALRARWPETPILVLSMHDEDVFAERSIASGANGYVGKREPADVIVQAIQRVLDGKVSLSPRITERLLEALSTPRSSRVNSDSSLRTLTERELDVLRRMGMACSTAQIARDLGISTKTVETHVGNIKEKLAVASSRELVVLAVHWLRDGFLECAAGRQTG